MLLLMNDCVVVLLPIQEDVFVLICEVFWTTDLPEFYLTLELKFPLDSDISSFYYFYTAMLYNRSYTCYWFWVLKVVS